MANELSNIEKLENLQKLKTTKVAAYQASIGISNDLFRSGKTTYLEVLFTQRIALESKSDLIITQKLQHQATINLYKALGGGWR